MPPPKPTARKRVRKRKRRAASSSSESSPSSDSDSSDGRPQGITIKKPTATPVTIQKPPSIAPEDSSSEDTSDSESTSSSSPQSDSDEEVSTIAEEAAVSTIVGTEKTSKARERRLSRSPSPKPSRLPPFLPDASDEKEQQEQVLKARFRKFWMEGIADGFKDDLEEIRKEPNMNTSRLALLIDSLASGAEVFTSSSKNGINEMEVVVG